MGKPRITALRSLAHVFMIGCMVAFFGADAHAYDTRIQVGPASELTDIVRANSLVLNATEETQNDPFATLATARADYRAILGVLYENGYFGGQISIRIDGREVSSLPPFYEPGNIETIALSVVTGKPFQFGAAKVAPLAGETILPEGFAPGQRARTLVISTATQTAIEGWRDRGFAKASIQGQRIVANHNQHLLNAEIILATGPSVSFGPLTIQGNTAVREKRVRQIAGYPEGVTYSPAALADVADRLRDTGTFRAVTLSEADNLLPGDQLGVTLELADEKPRRLGYGAELSSQEGAMISMYWLHRNIFGGAERLRFDAEVSGIGGNTAGIDYHLGARLTRPGTMSAHNTGYIDANIDQLDEPGYFSRRGIFEIGVERVISKRINGSLAIAYRRSRVSDASGQRAFTHLTLPILGEFDARSDRLNPKTGSFFAASVTPFVGLRGSASGAELKLDARGYYSLGADQGVTLAGRLQLGSIVGPSIGATPPDMLFYSGGGGSVRGQPYNSLGVNLGGGVVSGGSNFLGLSAEIRADISDKFGLVAFADQGYVGTGSIPGAGGNWHGGAGLGLRYYSGIGPIRFDLAVPTTGASGPQFYLGIGQSF